METTQIKENLLNLMNARSTNYEYVQNPDRTVRKSDGKFTYSDWDSATTSIRSLSSDGIPLEQATDMIASIFVGDSDKLFQLVDSRNTR
jgi:hypothetical protein